MRCPVCNQRVKENETYCMNCGNFLQVQDMEQLQNFVPNDYGQWEYQQESAIKRKKTIKTAPRWVAILLGVISTLLFVGMIILGFFYYDLNKEYKFLKMYAGVDELPTVSKDEPYSAITDEKVLETKPAKDEKYEIETVETEEEEDVVINVWSFTDEIPNMVQKYIDTHPDCGFSMQSTIIATTDGAYQPALDQALREGGADAPDIYAAEAAFVLKYTQGDAYQYAMPYEDLGIDVAAETKAADIAQYTIDIGTNPQGKLVGLGYQATGGAFVYRRSIAKNVWGTDDPKFVENKIGGGTNSWDKFFEAAAELRAYGYGIVSGDGDIWHAVENSSAQGWIVNGKLTIDPKREAFLDMSKRLIDNDYCNNTTDWQDAWFNDMKGTGPKQVFGFFGPAWLISYTLAPNCGGERKGEGTYGDWAVCQPPVGFFWGGTWLIANRNTKKTRAVRDIIRWITLDCSMDGLQYKWANGTLSGEGGTKDCVASGTVMRMSDGTLDFLGGQNMFDVFPNANKLVNGKNVTPYDETINSYWRQYTREYAYGNLSRSQALDYFKRDVGDILGLKY